jgi:hypothetical protein
MRVLDESEVSALLVQPASDACLALAKLLAVQSGTPACADNAVAQRTTLLGVARSPHEPSERPALEDPAAADAHSVLLK